MDTTEARTSHDERGPTGDAVYDGFISYSHAADDLLAPRLQAGLQRFAKPWWKRRALRIFRDEASLSANPHLWSSITTALDQSDWFVLLLSPDAADSEWVNNEVEYWLEHKDADRIIPVVTDGEFTWSETDIDLESTAVPPALYGAFSDEPRWVDLRFARSEELLDLNSPRFLAAVADIASAIRGVPKDELESEEVRQHRRTVRTAWGAGIVVLLLAIVAGGAALFALDQRNEAVANAARADENATRADENAAEAEDAATAEAEARREAERVALLFESKSLALEAELNLDIDPELSIWLAMSAVSKAREAGEESPVAVSSLHSAVQSTRIEQRLQGGIFVSAAPDADLVVTNRPQSIQVVNSDSGEVVGEIRGDPMVSFATPDDDLAATWREEAIQVVAVETGEVIGEIPGTSIVSATPGDDLAVTWQSQAFAIVDIETGEVVSALPTDSDPFATGATFGPGGVVALVENTKTLIWFPATGEVVTASLGEDAVPWSRPKVSPDGSIVAQPIAPADLDGGFGVPATELQLLSTGSGQPVVTVSEPLFDIDFAPDGETIAALTGDRRGIAILDVDTGEIVRTIEIELLPLANYELSFSPQGDRLVVLTGSVRMYDVASGSKLWEVDVDRPLGQTWTGDGSRVLIGADSGVLRVLDAATGVLLEELHGHGPFAWFADTLRDGERVITSDDFTLLIWDLSLPGGQEVAVIDAGVTGPDSHPRVTRDGWLIAKRDPPPVVASLDPTTGDPHLEMETPGRLPTTWNEDASLAVGVAESGSQTIASTSDGSVRYVAPPGWTIHGIGWDGSLVLLGQGPDDLLPRVVDTASGTMLFELADQVIFWGTGSFSRRGDLLMVGNQVYDVQTGDEVGGMPELGAAGYAFSPDSSMLAVTTWFGDLLLYDTTRLLDGLQLSGALILDIKAHNAQARGLGWSPDGSMVATAELGGQVRVWDPVTGTLLQEFDSKYDVDNQYISFHPTDPHIYTLGPNGTVRVYTHDVDELLAIAQSRLTRGMTEQECQQYLGGSCEDL